MAKKEDFKIGQELTCYSDTNPGGELEQAMDELREKANFDFSDTISMTGMVVKVTDYCVFCRVTHRYMEFFPSVMRYNEMKERFGEFEDEEHEQYPRADYFCYDLEYEEPVLLQEDEIEDEVTEETLAELSRKIREFTKKYLGD